MAGLGTGSAAIEFFEGRLEIHGFYEAQVRAIARDYSLSDGLDLTQWYNILNIEAEADFAPDGFGPFDLFQGFLRVDVRYDCVWTRGCGIFSSADAFGDRAKKLPKRLNDGRRAGYRPSGALFTAHTRRFADIPREFLSFDYRDMPDGSFRPSELFNIGGLDTLFGSRGVDGVFGTDDDPAPFYFSRQLEDDDCRFGFRATQGEHGRGRHPDDGALESQVPGAGRSARSDTSPIRSATSISIRSPARSAPARCRSAPSRGTRGPKAPAKDEAQGVYYPSYRLAQQLRDGKFGDFDQNFSQSELAWNRGASQQDEGELKEAYFDIEMFDSRLWLRLGKQTVVWGKTELFRNQDQWNPQDLALASLPSLEESRIGLWMARMVWHFWDVGPLEDVRAELVTIFDQFEPTDLGRCGEPYAPNPVCNKTLGLFIHGLTGFGIAGEIRPPDPWNSWKGIEAGGRLEWRWDRFSFALSDYWGYTDLPYQETLFRYSRNVDPRTGRPRWGTSTGSCKTGRESSCLTERNALTHHSVNQQLFTMICATSIGFSNLDSTACGQTVFTSQNPALERIRRQPELAHSGRGGRRHRVGSGSQRTCSRITGGGLFLALAGMDGFPAAQAEVRSARPATRSRPASELPWFRWSWIPTTAPSAIHPIRLPEPLHPVRALAGSDRRAGGAAGLRSLLRHQLRHRRRRPDERRGQRADAVLSGLSGHLRQLLGHQGHAASTSPARWASRAARSARATRTAASYVLPGCRGPGESGYDIDVDGSTFGPDRSRCATSTSASTPSPDRSGTARWRSPPGTP